MLEINWLGHATFQLRLNTGELLLLDPWLGGPTYPKAHRFDRIDAILVTHGHFDHMPDAAGLAKTFQAPVISNFEIGLWLGAQGVQDVRSMNKGGCQQVGPVNVTMTHAFHSSGIIEDGKVIYGGEAAGYVLSLPGGRSLYFAGDTDVFSEMELIGEIYKPELAFLPVGDLYTMGPKQAAVACRLLKARKVIPMHYGTFPPLTGRPEQLAELVRETGTAVWNLEIGKPVEW